MIEKIVCTCKRCTREILEEKYLLLGFMYCRQCMNALETDTWFKEFCKKHNWVQIEQT